MAFHFIVHAVLWAAIVSAGLGIHSTIGDQNDRPVIGILMSPTTRTLRASLQVVEGSMYVPSSYVSLYESVGARFAPIAYNLPKRRLKLLFDQINGLVLPGGAAVNIASENMFKNSRRASAWRESARYLLELAMESNDRGEPFPIHGICMGFEVLLQLTAQKPHDVVCDDCFASRGVALSLNFTPAANDSELFSAFPHGLLDALQERNTTFNSHGNGVLPSASSDDSNLTEFWNMLSTYTDMFGREFISTIEAKRYPFVAMQWHPEKPAFEFTGMEGLRVNHSQEAIEVGHFVARDLIARASRSAKRWASQFAEETAIIDKRWVVPFPGGFFNDVYLMSPQVAAGSFPEPRRVDILRTFAEKEPLGLPGKAWLPMTMELEMVECPQTALPVTRRLSSLSRQRVSLAHGDVVSWLHQTGEAVMKIMQAEPMSEALERNGKRALALRSLHIKDGHDDDDDLDKWNWGKEKSGRSELELSSPIDLSEEEMQFVLNVSKRFVGKFTGVPYSSFQSHVDGRCLQHEDRIVGLLLMHEKYSNALQSLIRIRYRGPEFARSLTDGNPELLYSLQRRWAVPNANQPLDALFRSHDPNIRHIESERDGFRNFAINVCHLLDIDCCRDCPKNLTPKFGGVEFRMFNTEFGAAMRVAVMIFQRMVQRSCTATLEELRLHTLNDGDQQATSIDHLLAFLDMDVEGVHDAFADSGSQRYHLYCGGN